MKVLLILKISWEKVTNFSEAGFGLLGMQSHAHTSAHA